MEVRFWGVRGSIPSPIPAEALEAKLVDLLMSTRGRDFSSPDAAKAYLRSLPIYQRGTVGGNTSCLEVRAGDQVLIIDAGSGIKALGWSLMDGDLGEGRGEVHILLSHTHWDHVQGFPFFQPAYVPGNRIIITGGHTRLRQRLKNQHHPDNFPVPLEEIPAEIQYRKLTPGKKKKLGAFTVEALQLIHPGDAYSFRVEHDGKALIYATDAAYSDLTPEHMTRYHEFYRDADALVFDAHFALIESFEKIDWGHSSSFIGVDIAVQSGVKRLVLFHHDPISEDERLSEMVEHTRRYLDHLAPEKDCEILIAYEGLELAL
jgi:phosphoribosyl 1,2-cyclic phosphodiesterase